MNFRFVVRSADLLNLLLGFVFILVVVLDESLLISLLLFNIFFLWVLFFEVRSGNLLKPTVGFTIFYYLYSTWYVYRLIVIEEGDFQLLSRVVNYSLWGFWVYLLFCLPVFRVKEIPLGSAFFSSLLSNRKSEKYIAFVCSALLVVAVGYIFVSGAKSKTEIVSEGMMLKTIADFLVFPLAVVFSIIYARACFLQEYCRNLLLLVFVFSVLFLAFLVSGERDWLFRTMICLLFIRYDYKRTASFSGCLLGVMFIVFMMPVSQALKAVFLKESFGFEVEGLALLFNGEFISASRNLYYIADNYSGSWWYLLLTDVVRGMTPFSGVFDLQSAGNWYNTQFRIEHGFAGESGWGFGLVAQGYVLGDYAGVAVVMSIVGLIVSNLYAVRYKSKYWYAFYILAMSSVIYSIRGDLASLLSLVFKVGGVSVILIYVVGLFMRAQKARANGF